MPFAQMSADFTAIPVAQDDERTHEVGPFFGTPRLWAMTRDAFRDVSFPPARGGIGIDDLFIVRSRSANTSALSVKTYRRGRDEQGRSNADCNSSNRASDLVFHKLSIFLGFACK